MKVNPFGKTTVYKTWSKRKKLRNETHCLGSARALNSDSA